MNCTLKLRSERKDRPVSIYAQLRSTNCNVWVSTGEVILPGYWNAREGMPTSRLKRSDDPDLFRCMEELRNKLQAIKSQLLTFADDCEKVGRPFTATDLSAIIKNGTKAETIPNGIPDYLGWLIGRMAERRLLNDSMPYTSATVNSWRYFEQVFNKFLQSFEADHPGKVLTWERLNKDVADSFISHLMDCGYTPRTINLFSQKFVSLVRFAYADELHNNQRFSIPSQKTVPGKNDSARVYLTTAEIEALYNMKLAFGSLEDRVRDVFLIGCYTGQRVSDYNSLTRDNFTTTRRGTQVIKLTQRKTGNEVLIPRTSGHLEDICEKYGYNLPTIGKGHGNVVINHIIKKLLARLSEEVPSLAEMVTTAKTKKMLDGRTRFEMDDEGRAVLPKWACVSSHTARRSFVTNLFISGRFTTSQLRSISGHKTEETFETYIRQSGEDVAEECDRIFSAMKEDEF